MQQRKKARKVEGVSTVKELERKDQRKKLGRKKETGKNES